MVGTQNQKYNIISVLKTPYVIFCVRHTQIFQSLSMLFLNITYFYQISSADGSTQIGMISKQWTGFGREFFTDAANFGIRCKDCTAYKLYLFVYI